jgi:two-component system response regulator VicR
VSKIILLIDKDPAIIDAITCILEDDGYQVHIAKKPFDILDVKTFKPALILLHNGLNNEGTLICQTIKSDSDGMKIPVIMSSTRSDLPQVAQRCGAEAYIQKPFDIDEFLNLIQKTINTIAR